MECCAKCAERAVEFAESVRRAEQVSFFLSGSFYVVTDDFELVLARSMVKLLSSGIIILPSSRNKFCLDTRTWRTTRSAKRG